MVELKNVSKTYYLNQQEIKAVEDINLNISKGEYVSIVGHSGCGKTTLLSLIGGLTKPDNGVVNINGINIWSIPDDQLSEFRACTVGFIFQFASLIPTLNVIENAILPVIFCIRDGKSMNFKKNNRREIISYAEELLENVGLSERLYAYPSQLSGGQQRRVAIARAFINHPEIILADEPTGDLDEETEIEMMNLFKKINKEKGITFIIVTHNLSFASNADRVLRMSGGRIIN